MKIRATGLYDGVCCDECQRPRAVAIYQGPRLLLAMCRLHAERLEDRLADLRLAASREPGR